MISSAIFSTIPSASGPIASVNIRAADADLAHLVVSPNDFFEQAQFQLPGTEKLEQKLQPPPSPRRSPMRRFGFA
jgi:hypothetical protein